MKFVFPILAALTCCGAVSAAQGYKPYAIDRYQSILDRMPFGPLPPNFTENGDPEPDPGMTAEEAKTAEEVRVEQQQLAKGIKVSCVNINPDGEVMVGFTDQNEKPPVNFYMAVGDERKGWSVVDADYDKEWAQLKKDDVVITMKLGEGLIDAPAGSKGASMSNAVASAGAPAAAPAARPSLLAFPAAASKAPIAPAASSFMERMKERAARTERERREQAALAKKQNEEDTRKLVEMAKQAALQELEKQRQEEELERIQNEQQPNGAVE